MATSVETIFWQLVWALNELNRSLEKKITTANDTLDAYYAQRVALNADIRLLDARFQKSVNAKLEIDNENMVELHDGHRRQIHYPGVMDRLPLGSHLIFDMTTSCPIRDYRHTSSQDASAWQDVQCALGETTFKAKVKIHANKSASAEVTLLGWSKEVHAAQISLLNSQLSAIEEERAACMAQLMSIDDQTPQIEALLAEAVSRRDACLGDQSIIESLLSTCDAADIILDGVAGEGSISFVAAQLDLKSIAGPGEIPLAFADEHQTFCEPDLSLFESLNSYIHHSHIGFRDGLAGLKDTSSQFITEVQTILDQSSNGWTQSLLVDVAGHGMEEALKRDLERDGQLMDKFKASMSQELEVWKDEVENQDSELDLVATAFNTSAQETVRYLDACGKVNSSMSGQWKDIGVATTFAVLPPSDAWLSLYHSELIN